MRQIPRITANSVKEITKLERTSLSDFTLCNAELLRTEERKDRVLHHSFTMFFITGQNERF